MEIPQLGDMNSFSESFGADKTSCLQSANMNSDSFAVEIERFSHLTSKNVSPNSRITRNLSRKGSFRGGDKKMSSTADKEKDGTNFVPNSSSSPKATSMPEKPIQVTVGATNNPFNQQIHHQITITTPTTTMATTTDNKLGSKRYSFKRSTSWTIDPKRILFFFATLSSMGTILLIYLTLAMKNVGGNGNTAD